MAISAPISASHTRSAVVRLIGAAVLIAIVSPLSARAECIPLWKTLKDAEAGSTLVFSDTVSASDDATLVTFDVDRVWKGKVTRRMTLVVMPGLEVRTAAFFKPEKDYVVFAIRSRVTPVYEVSFCSPTALVSDIGTDIAQRVVERGPASLHVGPREF